VNEGAVLQCTYRDVSLSAQVPCTHRVGSVSGPQPVSVVTHALPLRRTRHARTYDFVGSHHPVVVTPNNNNNNNNSRDRNSYLVTDCLPEALKLVKVILECKSKARTNRCIWLVVTNQLFINIVGKRLTSCFLTKINQLYVCMCEEYEYGYQRYQSG